MSTTAAVFSSTFEAMGSPAHVIVVGDVDLGDLARRRIAEIEDRWSRFRSTSELSRLNAAGAGIVSPDTIRLVQRAVEGWMATAGRFDPTVYDALVAQGYDRSFDEVQSRDVRPQAVPGRGCAGIVIDPEAGVVVLPPGVHLDPGGIGKGLAADIVVEDLMAAGAAGAMVSLGGDLRAEGAPPGGEGWSVAVEDPDTGGSLGVITMTAGAIATSSIRVQRWHAGGIEVHHLIDPSVGLPYRGDVVTVTALAAEGWWAEVATKDLMGKPAGTEPLEEVAAMVVTADGSVHLVGGMEAYLS